MKRKNEDLSGNRCRDFQAKERFVYALKKTGMYVCIIVILLFFSLICCANLFHYNYRMNADIASETLLGQVIWDSGQWIPESWYPSTEVRVIGTANLSALFYGISGSIQLAMGLACISVVLGIIYSIAYMFRGAVGGGKIPLATYGFVHAGIAC